MAHFGKKNHSWPNCFAWYIKASVQQKKKISNQLPWKSFVGSTHNKAKKGNHRPLR